MPGLLDSFDVRSLRDPHRLPGLREMTGLDDSVITRVRKTKGFWGLVNRIEKGIMDLELSSNSNEAEPCAEPVRKVR